MTSELVAAKHAHIFHVLDIDDNGFLEQSDFDRVGEGYAQIAGWEPGSEPHERFKAFLARWWEMLRSEADTGRDDSVSLDEFSALFSRLASSPDQIAGAGETVFDILDADEDGLVSLEEYLAFLHVYDIDDSSATAHFAIMDSNGDGRISRDEFATLVVDYFVSDDPQAPGSCLFGEVPSTARS